MATIDDVNALNIRPRTIIDIKIYDNSGTDLLLTITESELIRATVSLRSDLSRINPTLPESEIEIEAYFENDISEQLAAAGEKLEIRYRWAPDTVSIGTVNVRYFYTDERITWSNKVLHIHAVDQVYLLDEELPPIYIGQDWYWNTSSISDHDVLMHLTMAFYDFVAGTKSANNGFIKHFASSSEIGFMNQDGTFGSIPDDGALNIIQPRTTRREAIAKMMNICHWNFGTGELKDKTNFWLAYVDAGRPNLKTQIPSAAPRVIKKEDCGNFHESKEPRMSSLTATVSEVKWFPPDSGLGLYLKDENPRFNVLKGQGIAFEYGGFGDHYDVGFDENPGIAIFYERSKPDDHNARKRPPVDYTSTGTMDSKAMRNQYGKWLLDENVDTDKWATPGYFTYQDLSSVWNSPIPDNPSYTYATLWSLYVGWGLLEDKDVADASNASTHFISTDEKTITKTRGGSGEGVTLDDVFFIGHAIMRKYDGSGNITLLPDKGLECIMDKSNIVGSFTWKGDPRMQPRDFVELQSGDNLADQDGVLLQTEDGENIITYSSKIITLENITLTHEGGGTVAEITYREGYC